MPQKTLIAIGDDQMAFALFHVNTWRQFRRPGSGRVDDHLSPEFDAIVHQNTVFTNLPHARSQLQGRTMLLCAFHEESRGAWWI